MQRATDLERVDYADAYRVAPTPGGHSAERWLQVMFNDAPSPLVGAARMAWRVLGAELAPDPSPGHVFGCLLEVENHHSARMVVTWSIGLRARITAQADPCETIIATFVQLDTPTARRTWRVCAVIHRTLMAASLSVAGWRLAQAEDANA